MELRDALTQISEIRQHVARTETFRGYRALPVALSGLLALAAALLQQAWLHDPLDHIAGYLALWIGVAALSIIAMACELAWRWRRCHSPLEREKTVLAVTQLAPCLLTGVLLLIAVLRFAPESVWMLP